MKPTCLLPSRLLALGGFVLFFWGILGSSAGGAAPFGVPRIYFTEPLNGRPFMASTNVPIMLRAFAPDDVILSAEVFANGTLIGVATFCCPLCPCAHPLPGQETVLQIPTPWQGGLPPAETWQGWTNPPSGVHQLTARAVSQNGTPVQSPPLMISVRDVRLFIGQNSEQPGSYTLVIPNGALVDDGGFDLEASSDLRTWTPLGPFSPGNVAAFYWDLPPQTPRAQRFYRAVWVPSTR